jgi:hypothetical protein
MAGPGFLRSAMVWTHERGTLQYDIMCALILAFIFFVPKSCFTTKKDSSQPVKIQTSQKSPVDHQDPNSAKASQSPDRSAK